MQGLWRMSGLEHHKTDWLCGSVGKQTPTVVEQMPRGYRLNAQSCLSHVLGYHQRVAHQATVQIDQYQQQIIVSQGFIQAIQTGHRLNFIKSKTL